MTNCKNVQRLEACKKSVLAGNEVERTQGAKNIAGAEEHVFVEKNGQLESVFKRRGFSASD